MYKLANYIEKYMQTNNYAPKDSVLFLYGLNILIRYILFGITILFLLLFIGNIDYVLIYDSILIVLRFHCGGFHATDIKRCFILSMVTMVAVPEIFINFNIDYSLNFVITTMCFIIMICIKPLQNRNKHLNNTFVNRVNKRKVSILIVLYAIYLFQLNTSLHYTYPIMLSFFCNTLSIIIEIIRKEV